MSVRVHVRHALPGFTLDAAFEAPPGLTVLFGRSGSGKTSIINAVAGLSRPDHAQITVEGRTLADTTRKLWLPPHKRGLGYIFQEGRLFPHLTVRQNLTYGQWFTGHKTELSHVTEMLGLGSLLNRRPAALSGGEKQRVAIGRALLANPGLILADEPLAALDDARKADILPYFERLRDEATCPILYVTHSAAEVARLATSVVVIEAGRVVRQGSATEVLADAGVTPTGIRAVGAILTARIKAHHADGLTELDASGLPLFLPRVGQAEGAEMRVRIAAQDVILSRARPEGLSALNILPGRVVTLRAGEGPGALVTLETAAGRVLARVTRRSAERLGLAPGVDCHAVVKTVSIAREDVGRA